MRPRAEHIAAAVVAALAAGCGASTELIGDDPSASTATAFTGYTSSDSPLGFVNACAQADHQELLATQDDSTAPIALPFSFLFYRTRTSTAWISSNGVLGFAAADNSFGAVCLPDAMSPRAAIFALWADLYTRAGVCVATIGLAPHRQFVATWDDAHRCCADDPSQHFTFSVVLSEGSDLVDVQYSRLDGASTGGGSSGTVGVQNETGTRATQVECISSHSSVTAGHGVRFTPVP